MINISKKRESEFDFLHKCMDVLHFDTNSQYIVNMDDFGNIIIKSTMDDVNEIENIISMNNIDDAYIYHITVI